MSNHVIECFHKSDLKAVHDLIHNTIDVCYTPVYPERAVEYFKTLNTYEAILSRSESGTTYVAKDEAGIVGTGSVKENEVYAVFVSPALQRKGVGRALMTALEKIARLDGYSTSSLSVSLPSKPFYESLGYRNFEEQIIDVGNGQSLEYWQATKPLQ